MAYQYNIASRDGETSSASVFFDNGNVLTAQPGHANWKNIIAGLKNGADEDAIVSLFDVGEAINAAFTPLSERVMVRHGKVYFDGDEAHGAITKSIIRFFVSGHKDYQALVNFYENMELNPNKHSRDQLFEWLVRHNFAITPEGHFIAYKKVHRGTGRDDADTFLSDHSGNAIVNGREYVRERIPNVPGTVVEMPRSKVDDDSNQGCSYGLHAANWGYAHSFQGSVMLRVQINPRDVVSVPSEYNFEKLRTCRYKVLNTVTEEDTSMLYVDAEERTLFVPQNERKVTEIPTPKAVKKAAKKGAAPPKPVTKPAPKKAAPAKKTAAKKAAPAPAPVKRASTKTTAVKKEAAPKVTVSGKATKMPKWYEDFTEEHFLTRPNNELRWLVNEWEGKASAAKRDNAGWLGAEAVLRRDRKSKGERGIKLTAQKPVA